MTRLAKPKRILAADDDPQILRLITRHLSAHGMEVETAQDGSRALEALGKKGFDLVLLDAEMPGLDGHALCRLLKKGGQTRSVPVVLISGAWKADRDVVAGLEGGADDYLSKPFSMEVLRARVQAVLRRYEPPQEEGPQEVLRRPGLEINLAARTVLAGKKRVALTRKEFELLAELVCQAGRVVTSQTLLANVWGYDLARRNDPHTLEVHVSQLRRKLGAPLAQRIVSVPGFGYRFDG